MASILVRMSLNLVFGHHYRYRYHYQQDTACALHRDMFREHDDAHYDSCDGFCGTQNGCLSGTDTVDGHPRQRQRKCGGEEGRSQRTCPIPSVRYGEMSLEAHAHHQHQTSHSKHIEGHLHRGHSLQGPLVDKGQIEGIGQSR